MNAFLTAEWRYLVLLNYQVDPALLDPFVPNGTELDFDGGKTYLSMVGFHFVSTRLLGLSIPFHRNFEEVNLRFYVRRVEDTDVRRGVTFLRELVPRRAIAALAKFAYNEPYRALPMSHRFEFPHVEYSWRTGRRSNRLAARFVGSPEPLEEGSHEQFIAEHYWGYTPQPGGGTVEYRVAHPPWRIWQVSEATLDVDAKELYGPRFAEVLAGQPASAFVAEGSPVTVYRPRRL